MRTIFITIACLTSLLLRAQQPPLFTLLDPKQTGVSFLNKIEETPMAVIDHDHSYFQSHSASTLDAQRFQGVICVSKFLAFWFAIITAVWALHALVDWLF